MAPRWAGQLLVATPELTDPHFTRCVVLLLQHGAEGALGVVLDRPSDAALAGTLPSWVDRAATPPLVFLGGPVSATSAICVGRSAPSTPAGPTWAPLERADGTTDPLLGTVDLDAPPDDALGEVRVFAGYAGWSRGQLEREVERGDWWVLDALPGDPFTPAPRSLWGQVLRRQGLPLALMVTAVRDPRVN